MKRITLCMALAIVVSMMTYSAFTVGTLFHELTHASQAIEPNAIEIHYDTTGAAYSDRWKNLSEPIAYLNGAVIEGSLMMMGIMSMIVIVRYKHE